MSISQFSTLANSVQVPDYDRHALKPRIAHIGFGAFARAHQAFVLDQLHHQGKGGDWGVVAVYVHGDSSDMAEAFKAQDCLYSVMRQDQHGQQISVCGALIDVVERTLDGIDAIVATLANAQTNIIALTVTEKGYCLNGKRRLDLSHPGIKHDLANPAQPSTAIGAIYAALVKRKTAGLGGLSVLSCDNIPSNGDCCRQAVMDFAEQVDADMASWITEQVSFPNTMVDRIVPAVSKQGLEELSDALGADDPQGVICEPFLQWVIEDNFKLGRPDWDNIEGVQFVDDVSVYEKMKLRTLNGAHSFLAYLGYLGGYEHISDTMQDKHYLQAAKSLMLNEQIPTLPAVPTIDLAAYANELIERFKNPMLKHRTWQIAADGSQKLPQRLLESAQYHLERGQAFPHIALGVAAWMAYVRGVDAQGKAIDVVDPYADTFKQLAEKYDNGADYVRAMLNQQAVFPSALSENAVFERAVLDAYLMLMDKGARQAVAQLQS